MGERLDYASPHVSGSVPWTLIAFCVVFPFTHILCEILVWVVAFYGFGFHSEYGEQLWEREIFVGSLVIEVGFAIYSLICIGVVVSVAWFLWYRTTIWWDVMEMAIMGSSYSLSRWLTGWTFGHAESERINWVLVFLLPVVLPALLAFRRRRRDEI